MFAKTFEKVLMFLVKNRPLRRIEVAGEPYLDRYYLFGDGPHHFPGEPKSFLGFLPFTVLIHCFHQSDQDRDLHNHPWKARSLILLGGYHEEYRVRLDESTYKVQQRTVKPGRFNKISPEHFHRVDLRKDRCWTLFVIGKRSQTWGFWNRETYKFTQWEEYLRQHYPEDSSLEFAKGE